MQNSLKIKVKLLTPRAQLPTQGSKLAAGWDCYACLPDGLEKFRLEPGTRAVVPLGFSVELPENYEMQIRSRSGLAYKDGVQVLNSPGTIDADYRGECMVILQNHGRNAFEVIHGARIAQAVFKEVPKIELILVDELSDTDRGAGKFGSTGA